MRERRVTVLEDRILPPPARSWTEWASTAELLELRALMDAAEVGAVEELTGEARARADAIVAAVEARREADPPAAEVLRDRERRAYWALIGEALRVERESGRPVDYEALRREAARRAVLAPVEQSALAVQSRSPP